MLIFCFENDKQKERSDLNGLYPKRSDLLLGNAPNYTNCSTHYFFPSAFSLMQTNRLQSLLSCFIESHFARFIFLLLELLMPQSKSSDLPYIVKKLQMFFRMKF